MPATSPRATKVTRRDATSGLDSNPETYLGLQYQDPSQPLIEIQAGAHDYPAPPIGSVEAPQLIGGGQIALLAGQDRGRARGQVDREPEEITSDAPAATILLGVHAEEVNLVMATETGKPIDAVVAARRSAGSGRRTAARACTSTPTAARS